VFLFFRGINIPILENLPPPRIKGKEERENIKGKRTDRRGKR
jgi:hypothetical protein